MFAPNRDSASSQGATAKASNSGSQRPSRVRKREAQRSAAGSGMPPATIGHRNSARSLQGR